MRIAIFTESYRPVINGVSTSIDTFARELRKLSHEIVIFAPRYPGYRETDSSIIRVRSYITPFQRDYPLAHPIIPGLARRFEQMKFDLVHTQAPFTLGRVGMRLARQFNLPLVTTNHTVYTEYTHYLPLLPSGLTRRGIMWIMESYCNNCDYVVTPSESVRQLLESLGVTSPIRAVPTGPMIITPATPDPEFPRKHFNIPEKAPLLLYAGRIAKEKNMEMLIDAFQLVCQKVPETRLILAGGGPYEEATRLYVSERGLDDSVIFTGFISHEQLFKCYADATAFLFASTTDAQGLVITEAMMQGLPSVATAAYGPTEWIRDRINGILCQNSPGSMADGVLRLIKDPDLRLRMGKAAHQDAMERSAPRCAEMMLEVYGEAAKRHALRVPVS